MEELKALIFDCDGVIAETERDGHRRAFNRVFKEEGIECDWDVDIYRDLVKVSGGKERMKCYFGEKYDDEYIKKLHKRKTEIYMEMSENGELPIRPGIKRLIKEAHDKGIILAVCSTSNEKSVVSLIKAVMGEECFVVEDSRNGLLSAKAAGMNCIVTVSYYSADEDFSEADLVVSSLGDLESESTKVLIPNEKINLDIEYIILDVLDKLC